MAHKRQLYKGEADCIAIIIKSGEPPRERIRRKFMRYLEKDLFPYKQQKASGV